MDELLDIVNDDDLVIDQQPRSRAHQLGLQHRGVHVLLLTADGKMLVQKRNADRAASPSALDCSVSEHVKAGETYFQAAVRGMWEEIGTQGMGIRPIVKIRMNYGPNDNEISTIFEGRVDPARVKFDRVEIEDVGYQQSAVLRQMSIAAEADFCPWFVEILKWKLGEPHRFTILQVF